MIPRIYLAGPEVFLPNALEIARELKETLARVGLEGVFPFDVEIEPVPTPETGRKILQANLDLIDSCQAVLAQMSPFRGPSMDVGTAFEMGYAHAQGKPIVGYSDDLDAYHDKVARSPFAGATPATDHRGHHVENFAAIDNIMVAFSPRAIVNSAAEAAALLAEILGKAAE